MLKVSWWKWLAMVLMVYTIIAGFLFKVPRLPIVNETVRNQHFHVSMWFGMIILLLVSLVYSVKYLLKGKMNDDIIASEAANGGILFGILGITTGMIWANYTWGAAWSGDPKQNGAAIGLLLYLAYAVLRGAITESEQRARIAAIYNIFCFFIFIPVIYILPKLNDSLHPGSGGNATFASYDMDNNLRLVFYPAVIGWTLLVWWMGSIRVRMKKLQLKALEN